MCVSISNLRVIGWLSEVTECETLLIFNKKRALLLNDKKDIKGSPLIPNI